MSWLDRTEGKSAQLPPEEQVCENCARRDKAAPHPGKVICRPFNIERDAKAPCLMPHSENYILGFGYFISPQEVGEEAQVLKTTATPPR
jgi:hypothetical protein